MTERQLQAAIVDTARLLGWRAYHTHDSRRSEPGYPDLTLVRGRRLIFAELKTAKGRVAPGQQTWLDELSNARAETYLWRPDDWTSGEVERVLRGDL